MNKWTKRYLDMAEQISSWSKDPSTKVGAVCVSPLGQVLATGYNGFPRGISDSDSRLTEKTAKYQRIVHAEMNCIYNACYNGLSLKDSTMYIYGLPVCSECAKGLIQSGITKVIIRQPKMVSLWEDHFKLSNEMFDEAGVVCLRYDSDDNLIE